MYIFLRRGSAQNVRMLIISLDHSKSPVNYRKVRYTSAKFVSSISLHITTAYTEILNIKLHINLSMPRSRKSDMIKIKGNAGIKCHDKTK